MKRNFFEVKRFLEYSYPQLPPDVINGENYPPPLFKQYLASAATMIWLFGLLFLFGSNYIFESLGIVPPEFIKMILEQKTFCFIALFLLNSFGAGLLATGAFEISYNGKK